MLSSLIPLRQLLVLVPKPVEAVLLVFPITEEFDKIRKSEDERLQEAGQPHLDPTLFYIKQTVRRHCLLA
jgi:ubiquitin carboxyl-terminal hydrolase L3